jgi:anti-sigma-K factor RskA
VALVAAQPGVTGSVEGRPGGMHVEVTVPAGIPAGHDLEVWDTATGAPRSLGVLVADGARTHWQGDLALPAPGGMPPLDVSLEPVGAGPQHSGISLAHTP